MIILRWANKRDQNNKQQEQLQQLGTVIYLLVEYTFVFNRSLLFKFNSNPKDRLFKRSLASV